MNCGESYKGRLSWLDKKQKSKDSNCHKYSGTVPKPWNTINLSRIKAFSSTFEENAKLLFCHLPKNLFVFKLTSYSTASSTIIKYFKSRHSRLLKNPSSSVLLYLDNLIPRPQAFKNRTCAKILIASKNRFIIWKKRWLKGCSCGEKFAPLAGKFCQVKSWLVKKFLLYLNCVHVV